MATDLTDFLWNKFPEYYPENDTNKDINGKGTFQRFLSVFGLELTNEVINKLENFIDELDPYTADDVFLTQIAWALGNPPDILQDTEIYRTILSQIIKIYQIKGTKKSYELLFALLGFSVELDEIFPGDNQYDIGLIYDDDSEEATTYDFNSCEVTCTPYDLLYTNLPGRGTDPLSSDQEDALKALITDLIEPLGAVLRDLTYATPEPPTPAQFTIHNNSTEDFTWELADSQLGPTIDSGPLPAGESLTTEFTDMNQYWRLLGTETRAKPPGCDIYSDFNGAGYTFIAKFSTSLGNVSTYLPCPGALGTTEEWRIEDGA